MTLFKRPLKWQQSLSQFQNNELEGLAAKALRDSINGKTKKIGFDQLLNQNEYNKRDF